MEFLDLHKLTDESLLTSGKILIAQPFMKDSVFTRSVVFLCEHNEEGSLGFVLNQPTGMQIGDVVPEMEGSDMALCQGGPVQLDTLHMLHRMPEEVGGAEVASGVFWGGSFDALKQEMLIDNVEAKDLKLFVGYSGWSQGQLADELKTGSWLIGNVTEALLFETAQEDVWSQAVNSLGNEYQYLNNLPIDPQLN